MEQSLLFSEDLTPPSFQVIVINANMSCNGCRQRVSQLLSKISELVEFTIDVTKKQVVVKGNVKFQGKIHEENGVHSQTYNSKSLKSQSLTHQFSNNCF
ncbi:uncharacterized protein LOC111810871 [Cucurbita pepo subsp. pepo]|uniref:uncharacterized protein LOC111810871 n=1 Tax=Cucurbita pepo subsp. pepo TaxID=3664 RepID=UPI000C9DA50F|nr:uncharacterized protein LOC111810871 [Cucurbita pepo subsp. pepo]